MTSAPIPGNESARLAALRECAILDTAQTKEFDDIASLAAQICGTPIAVVNFLDADRQWFKAHPGIDVSETPRNVAFCAHSILQKELFLVPDAMKDRRFADNPLVTGAPHIRFYAGAPLIDSAGYALGTVAVIDRVPRELTAGQQEALLALGRETVALVELHRRVLAERRTSEVATRARLAEVLERVSDGFVSLDATWRYTYVNVQAATLFGRKPEDLIGKHIWTEFPEGVGQPFYHAYHRALADQQPVQIEEFYAPWNRWFENRIFPSAGGLSIFFHEITDRKHAALAVQRERDFSNALIDSLPGVFYLIDPQRRLVRWNKNFERVTGYSAAEIQRLDSSALFPSEDLPRVQVNFQAVLSRGEAGLEASFVTKDGRLIPHYFTGLRVMLGETPCMAGVGIDITERKLAEAARLESEARYRDLFDSANDFILFVSPEGRLVFANPAFRAALGYSEAETAALRLPQLIAPDCISDCQAQFQRVAGGEPVAGVEAVFLARDGRRVAVEGNCSCSVKDGRVEFIRGIFRDVTGRQEAEALVAGQKQVLEMIASGTSLAETLDSLVRLIEAQSSGMLGSILLLKSDGVHVRHGAAPNLPAGFNQAVDGQPIGPRAGSCGTAMFRGEPVIVEDIAADPLWSDYRGVASQHGLRACWSTPIFDAQRRVLGSFACYFREPRRPGERDFRLIEITTHLAAIAIVKEREEQALRASETRVQLAVRASNIGHWDWDIEHGRLFLSPEWKAQIGYADNEIRDDLGEWESRVHPDDLKPAQEKLRRHLDGSGPNYETEIRLRHKDGSYRWIYTRAELFRDANGKPCRMLGCHVDITERKLAEAALRGLTARLLRAQDEERRRLARELHDTTAQNLAALAMNISVMAGDGSVADPRLRKLIADCEQLVERSVGELRTVTFLLHPPLLDEFGLKRAMRDYAEGFASRSGLRVELDLADELGRLPDEIELALFRVLQEGLGNVHRHSGSPSAHICLARAGGEVTLEVRDVGRGMGGRDQAAGLPAGVGIAGMRERLRQLGGRLEIESDLPGTRVRAILPLKLAIT